MKIGIIVHSHTGNTYSVAQKLQTLLSGAGHEVNLERIQVAGGEKPNVRDFRLENPPNAGAYDALIFGAPVRGFALSPIMTAYLKQLQKVSIVKTACFVTMSFPFPWLGGTNAISRMTDILTSKTLSISETGIINWSGGKREKQINNLVERIGSLFTET